MQEEEETLEEQDKGGGGGGFRQCTNLASLGSMEYSETGLEGLVLPPAGPGADSETYAGWHERVA